MKYKGINVGKELYHSIMNAGLFFYE